MRSRASCIAAPRSITATHDIGEAAEYDQVLLLARRVVALGTGDAVLTPDRLLETFGIVIRDLHEEHAGPLHRGGALAREPADDRDAPPGPSG